MWQTTQTKNSDGTISVTSVIPEFVVPVEVAAMIGITRLAVMRLIDSGYLRGVERGGRVMMASHEVFDLIEDRRREAIASYEELRQLEEQIGLRD